MLVGGELECFMDLWWKRRGSLPQLCSHLAPARRWSWADEKHQEARKRVGINTIECQGMEKRTDSPWKAMSSRGLSVHFAPSSPPLYTLTLWLAVNSSIPHLIHTSAVGPCVSPAPVPHRERPNPAARSGQPLLSCAFIRTGQDNDSSLSLWRGFPSMGLHRSSRQPVPKKPDTPGSQIQLSPTDPKRTQATTSIPNRP